MNRLPPEYEPTLASGEEGPWKVVLYIPGAVIKGWWIFNTETRAMRYIGPVRKSGTNYCDKAHFTAGLLNAKLKAEGG